MLVHTTVNRNIVVAPARPSSASSARGSQISVRVAYSLVRWRSSLPACWAIVLRDRGQVISGTFSLVLGGGSSSSAPRPVTLESSHRPPLITRLLPSLLELHDLRLEPGRRQGGGSWPGRLGWLAGKGDIGKVSDTSDNASPIDVGDASIIKR